MAEEEQEFHVCHVCGADDLFSKPFYKDGDGKYWCPECRIKGLVDIDILPCSCGSKPAIDFNKGYIWCPKCFKNIFRCYGGEPVSVMVEEWNQRNKPKEEFSGVN